ncbi:MAG: glycosyltransferase family 39 protein [Chloroflexota bacterium]|nr:glycosyltransferase family 39 protein [Chloroflexota bacterium]
MKAHSNGTTVTPQLKDSPTGSATSYSFWKDPLTWALVVAAFAFRVFYNAALQTDGHTPLDFVIDEREYFSAAHMLAEGRGFAFYNDFIWVRPPVYVLFLGGLFALGGGSYHYPTVLLAQSLISAVSLLPFGWLAAEVRGRAAARWTLALGALYLPFVLFAGLLVSETLFLLLFGLALLALWRGRRALVVEGQSRRAYLWLAGAGVLLGCATLTRSTALLFVFIAALWLLLSLPRTWTLRWWAIPAVLLVLVGLATLLPWTVRNYAAYHRFIPVDTTGGYNLWLASLGVRDEPRMQDELRRIEGQGERQDYAFSRAWETIGADPAAFAGKGLKESLDLWKPLLSAEENAVRGYPSGRVPAWHLAFLLIFDNVLYVAILLFAVAGLALSKPTPLKWLTLGWVLLWVLMSFVFFAVTRFRMPVVASLLPWAAVGITTLPRLSDWRSTGTLTRMSSAAATLAILAVVVLNVPLGDTLDGMRAWERQAPYREGERLLMSGQVDGAVTSYRAADMNVGDTRYGLAAALLQHGKPDEAMSVLRQNEPEDRYEPLILKGQAARMRGNLDDARSFFNARVVQVAGDEALRWAWDHLRPEAVQSIDVGSGLDVGYVRGFHGPETDANGRPFRWSKDIAEVRGLAGGICEIEWNGWRPSGLPVAEVTLTRLINHFPQVSERFEIRLPNSPDWIIRRLASPEEGGPPEIQVNAFVVSGSDPRLVGVQVSRANGCQR